MHGRRRQALKEPSVDEKEQSRQRVEKYCALNTSVMNLRVQSVFTTAALDLTKRLLEVNTELHTVWNYRRQIFMHLDSWQDLSQRQQLLESELSFVFEIIMKNVKSYWMWNHRVWTLNSMPQADWRRELALVAKLLSLDARNFHGWDYRRFVVSKLEDMDVAEFAYTTEQINKDCANHSAWHNRSKLLPGVLAKSDQAAEMMRTERDLILNAVYTDPDDQNAWLYHEWLVSIQPSDEDRCRMLRDKVAAIHELLELEEDEASSKRPLIELVDALAAIDGLEKVTDDEKKECLETLHKLKSIDTYHVGRYSDMIHMLSQRWGMQ
ncbi:Rab geranylgeranyltransferase [Coemansia aciculifera]|uniref:Geranylgeranyl transferase type-2 subunit alpha n=1 Tax=Coemansia aciculifera TaxID=417176 RepID=A0A9W8M898_9FUNG|nr:Rab geranylgeranyltransferase [Coemansia aciculifera]KAJ2873237.1 Rab geranylgeranyltransferase [Coemansia aciculifera]